jgi:hypothetical protein
MMLAFNVQATEFEEEWTPAIQIQNETKTVYTNFDIASEKAQLGDTFLLGEWNDTELWRQTDNDNALKQYLNLSEPTTKTLKQFEAKTVWDYWEYNNPEKQIKSIMQYYFKLDGYNRIVLDYINYFGVKK